MQHGMMHDVRWIRPEAVSQDARAEVTAGVGRAIEAYGLPAPPRKLSVKEEAIFFLKTAAEIEHALLVQYLYAAYSLNEALGGEVQDWQSTIVQIAKEEMGHLVSVENLLLVLGAKPWVNRPSYPIVSGFSPFPFRLEPMSRHSLAKYVVAESPLDIPPEVEDDFAAALKDARVEDGAPLSVHKVGVLYAYLYWLFQPDDNPTDPWRLPHIESFPAGKHIATADLQPAASLVNKLAIPSEFHVFGRTILVDPRQVSAATNPDKLRAACLQTLAEIVSQGEGQVPAISEGEPHFNRFLNVYKGFVAYLTQHNSEPVRAVPTNPATSGSFTNATTVLWAVLFNKRYQILLVELVHALSLDRVTGSSDHPAGRAQLTEWSIGEMLQQIRGLGRQLMQMPRTAGPFDPAKSPVAAPPFEVGPTPLPEDDAGLWLRQRQLIEDCKQLIQQLTQYAPAEGWPQELADILQSIQTADETALAGMPP